MALKELLAGLDKLTPKERTRVQARLNALRGTGQSAGVTADAALESEELFALSVLADYVKRAGLGFEGLNRLRASSNFPAFREKLPGLMKFIDKQGCNQNEKRVLLMYGFEMLHENITRLNIAADARALMNHVHRMPAVFDASFPGYGHNGFLGMLVRRRITGANEED